MDSQDSKPEQPWAILPPKAKLVFVELGIIGAGLAGLATIGVAFKTIAPWFLWICFIGFGLLPGVLAVWRSWQLERGQSSNLAAELVVSVFSLFHSLAMLSYLLGLGFYNLCLARIAEITNDEPTGNHLPVFTGASFAFLSGCVSAGLVTLVIFRLFGVARHPE